ncbi:MAG TPA: methyltransferase domain-containing protein [Burkholderiaceae bacterium]|nr:methyltransferase domain-containing protein [Burkholderiaceae bacterium]
MGEPILSIERWLRTPLGAYLKAWEQDQCDAIVSDLFGYHALQLGLPELQTLQSNRMPHRWLAVAHEPQNSEPIPEADNHNVIDFVTDYTALPFFENSLDLLVLPHTLELSTDPHATLREAQRVLVPEGKLLICSFNPISLWGGKRWRQPDFIPEVGELIGNKRLKDWLKLLNFEIEISQFGCHRPAIQNENWLNRFAWMDKLGKSSWSLFGAVHLLVAVKKVHGVRMMSPNWQAAKVKGVAPVSIARKL